MLTQHQSEIQCMQTAITVQVHARYMQICTKTKVDKNIKQDDTVTTKDIHDMCM